jgi:hypothetical protein
MFKTRALWQLEPQQGINQRYRCAPITNRRKAPDSDAVCRLLSSPRVSSADANAKSDKNCRQQP